MKLMICNQRGALVTMVCLALCVTLRSSTAQEQSGDGAKAQNPYPTSVLPKTPQPQAPQASDSNKRDQDAADVSSSKPAPYLGAANGDYVLKTGDTIEMEVFREPDLRMQAKIGRDGFVSLPLLGEIKLGGFTIRAATSFLRDKYNADYLVNPQVYLDIASYATSKFTIIGQVGRPGAYECGGSDQIGLLEAIGMAGGFSRIADRGNIIVKRRDGNVVKTIKVNAKKLTESGTDPFEIKPGDVIDVHESWY